MTLVANVPGDEVNRAVRELVTIWVPVLTGLFALRSSYSERFGRALVAAGLLWSLTALGESPDSLLYSIGRLCGWLGFPFLFYLLLSFPSGRLAPGLDRALYAGLMAVLALYVGSALFVAGYPPHTPWASCVNDCPPNAFLVLGHEPAV